MQYWLMKSEPDVYGWSHLNAEKNATDHWDGVRNYAARNHMRAMKEGDLCFFYHSRVNPPHIAGIVKVVREAYVDPTQFDPEQKYYDPKSSKDNPRWDMVDIRAERELSSPVTIAEIKEIPALKDMVLLNNSRLSVQPVTKEEWDVIVALRP